VSDAPTASDLSADAVEAWLASEGASVFTSEATG